MINISEFLTGIVIVNAVALALLVAFGAVELTRAVFARRDQRTTGHVAPRGHRARPAFGH